MLKVNCENFELDGKKFNIYSGTIHYFRTRPEYWADRLKKLKLAGFNTVETYVCWNLHEPQKGEFDFSGMLDIAEFLKEAQRQGLYAIVRPGPYICAEWDFGGLPAWLLKDKNMQIRCNYPDYLDCVKGFYTELFKYIEPMQITNGGNIIAMQVENEYGSYGNDKEYLRFVEKLMIDCGCNVLMFTSDGPTHTMLSGGTLPNIIKMLNFGSGSRSAFKYLNRFEEKQPKMCAEFWCGWFDHFGEKHHTRGYQSILHEINGFFEQDASFNFYMFHGGTNFGFNAGANCTDFYQPTVTSYDYCALLTEWGDYTPAYHAVRKLMHDKQGLKLDELPNTVSFQNIGSVPLIETASLMKNLDNIGERHYSPLPETMEYYGQNFGMIYYETKLEGKYNEKKIKVSDIHDRAYLYVNDEKVATLQRKMISEKKSLFKKRKYEKDSFITLKDLSDSKIGVLVDAMGRVNYGPSLCDRKGIRGVRINYQELSNFNVITLPLDNIEKLKYNNSDNEFPLFYKGEFKAQEGKECFVHMNNFTKGYVFVNGFNLGRYWEIGPQMALYLPGSLLKETNEIVILELEDIKNPNVIIDDKPDLG
ncbi:MAG: beta-galactosidase [Oscillospiraceae bacterium]